MNEKRTNDGTVRPTKKQREILTFIEQFIGEHGYSPSYREIMTGLDYTSVATVSLHVNSLIRRGHLRKRDRSARSLEVVVPGDPLTAVSAGTVISAVSAPEQGEAWLIGKTETAIRRLETAGSVIPEDYDSAATLVQALQVLGLGQAYAGFVVRLTALEARAAAPEGTPHAA